MTDGTPAQSGTKVLTYSGQWNLPVTVTSFKEGPITLTVTVTDPAGNPTVTVSHLVKDTVAPAGSFTVVGTTINGYTATNNATLALNLGFTATSGIGTVAFSTNGGWAYPAPQAPAPTPTSAPPAAAPYSTATPVMSTPPHTPTSPKPVH